MKIQAMLPLPDQSTPFLPEIPNNNSFFYGIDQPGFEILFHLSAASLALGEHREEKVSGRKDKNYLLSWPFLINGWS